MYLRVKILGILFTLICLVLLAKLFYWQVIEGDELSAQARAQQRSGEKLMARRGSILASDGSWLVSSGDSFVAFSFLPDLKDDPRTVANSLAPLFVEKKEEDDERTDKQLLFDEAIRIEGLLTRKDVTWVPLKRKVKSELKKRVESLDINGIGFDLEEARVYPESSLSAHLLGFVGKDDEGQDKGYFGLEGYYDVTLGGKPGYLERESNAVGTPLLFGEAKKVAAAHGVDLVTHIDKTMQLFVESELKKGLERYGALNGTVIVMNPKDGGIKAMATFPNFDPAHYADFSNDLFKNPSISDSFEPGSIFKPIIMASGLDADVIEPDTVCDICDRALQVDTYTIHTWDDKYYKDSTMTEVLMHSDNVGMSFVAQRLGKERLISYLKKFGIGKLTGIDLQGEFTPALRKDKEWANVDVYTASFGQGIAVTPIQMIAATAVIANKGVPVTPQVVDKLKVGTWEGDIDPQYGERAISEEAARKMTEMMVAATKKGEAQWTVMKGFSVAGKTGTAQIPVAGHYDAEKTIASFIGFAPADDPKFIMLVTLREPQSSQWASETAAPLWFSIAKELFPYMGIQPED